MKTQNTPKTSITQRLSTDLGRSVGVTTAIQLMWLNRFYGYQLFSLIADSALQMFILHTTYQFLWVVRNADGMFPGIDWPIFVTSISILSSHFNILTCPVGTTTMEIFSDTFDLKYLPSSRIIVIFTIWMSIELRIPVKAKLSRYITLERAAILFLANIYL